jgi:hypothetical protein
VVAVGAELLNDLERMAPEIRWHGRDRSVVYALFSKAGFTSALRETAAERDNVHLYTAADVVGLT